MLRKVGLLTMLFTILLFMNMNIDVEAKEKALVTLENYDVLEGVVAQGEIITLSLTFKNKSMVSAEDVMIYAYNPNGDIFPIFGEENPLYIGDLGPGESYQREATICVSENLIKNNYLQLNFSTAYLDNEFGEKTNSVFLSIPIADECRLKLNNISIASKFSVLQTGIISINYRNTGKKTINSLGIRIKGNIEGDALEYYIDSLGVEIENNIDCYIKFLKAGDQDISLEAFYTDDDGTKHILDSESITVTVADSIESMSVNRGLKDSGLRNKQLIKQGVIILGCFVVILIVVIWKNSRTKLIEKEAR